MKITKKHRDAINELLKGKMTKAEIAKHVHVARSTLYEWLKDDDFKAELEERESDYKRMISARISKMAFSALDTQEDIMSKSDNDRARASVAADILNRAGYTKTNIVELKTPEDAVADKLNEVFGDAP
ncbi:MAG: phBC6A51 family helix-turn-helix protein [Candidatus Ornithomonoglobus sp.]